MARIGWRFESARHSLAARGVKTRYNASKTVKYYRPEEVPGQYGRYSFLEGVLASPVSFPVELEVTRKPKSHEELQREVAEKSDVEARAIIEGRYPGDAAEEAQRELRASEEEDPKKWKWEEKVAKINEIRREQGFPEYDKPYPEVRRWVLKGGSR